VVSTGRDLKKGLGLTSGFKKTGKLMMSIDRVYFAMKPFRTAIFLLQRPVSLKAIVLPAPQRIFFNSTLLPNPAVHPAVWKPVFFYPLQTKTAVFPAFCNKLNYISKST
jgi:hypothetical protein